MRLNTLIGMCAAAALGCAPVGGTTTATDTSGSSSSSSGSGEVGYNFTVVQVGSDDPSGNGGLGLAVSDDGEVALAYFTDLTTTRECVTNFDTKMVRESQLRLARGTGEDFTVSTVETTRSADGVAAAFDGAGALNLAFTGGENGAGSCAASDLVRAVVPAQGTPMLTTLATDSANGGVMCRLMQNACNSGDVVGRYPALLFDEDDTMVVAFQDNHFGFAVETDFEGADLEVMVGGTRHTVDDSSGAGNFSTVFLAEGRPAVAHVVIVDHQYEGGVNKSRGIWLAWLQEDGTWLSSLVDVHVPVSQIGAAWHPTQGFAVAFQEKDQKDLYVATSADGMTWQRRQVASIGNLGRTPAVAFAGDDLLIAFGACSGPEATGSACDSAEDGVMLAIRHDGQWRTQTVHNDDEFLDGTDIRMALTASGEPVIAFKSQGRRAVMLAYGSRR